MSLDSGTPTREAFDKWVRSALRQLYDSPSLTSHPLAKMLAGEGAGGLGRAQNLRRLLIEAIQALRPPGTPVSSPARRTCRILELRYLEGLSPAETMDQVALQKSRFYELEARAIRAVADHLWQSYQRHSPTGGIGNEPATHDSLVNSETALLCATAAREDVKIAEILESLRPTLHRLAEATQTAVRIGGGASLQVLRANRVLVRQAVLNAVSYALDMSHGGTVEIGTFAQEDCRGVRIEAQGAGDAASAAQIESQQVRMDVCGRLMAASKGELRLRKRAACVWEMRLEWPLVPPKTLLVVDDNQGFADLFRRYLSDHNWQVLHAADGVQARQMIVQSRPTVITLDVLMPQTDGWELLSALKTAAPSCDIPVIVCSVLREPQLALSLGAAAYLPKPVTEQSLLEALTPWSRGPE